jgi:hypothetical protein
MSSNHVHRQKKHKIAQNPTKAAQKTAKADRTGPRKGSRDRVAYTEAQDLMIMKEVMGNESLFDRCGASKVDCWVALTQRLSYIFGKDLTAEGPPQAR